MTTYLHRKLILDECTLLHNFDSCFQLAITFTQGTVLRVRCVDAVTGEISYQLFDRYNIQPAPLVTDGLVYYITGLDQPAAMEQGSFYWQLIAPGKLQELEEQIAGYIARGAHPSLISSLNKHMAMWESINQ